MPARKQPRVPVETGSMDDGPDEGLYAIHYLTATVRGEGVTLSVYTPRPDKKYLKAEAFVDSQRTNGGHVVTQQPFTIAGVVAFYESLGAVIAEAERRGLL